MGDTYLVYTEIQRGNRWECIDPYLPKLNKNTGQTEMRLLTTYENGSRSYFSSTYDKVRELGRIWPDDLSETLQKLFPRRHNEDPSWQQYYNEACYVVPLQALKDALPPAGIYQYHGVYHKDAIYAFEHDELDELYESITSEEYKDLPEEMRKCYQYYEWNSPWDWPDHFKTIIERANIRIYDWKEFNYEFDEPEVRLVFYRF